MDEKEFLEKYDDSKYDKPSVTADLNVFSIFEEQTDNYRKLTTKKLKILLIRRGRYPFKDMFALPGGFVRKQETVDQAAFRELKEETGIECTFLQQLRTFSEPDRDPRRWVITCAYMALIDGKNYSIVGGDDATEALWFDVSLVNIQKEYWKLELYHEDERIEAILKHDMSTSISEFTNWELVKSSNIAFDHALIITAAVIKLRKLVTNEESNVIFKLLPDYFTLTEVQQVYEVILDKKLCSQTFRRQIKDLVEETQEYAQSAGHRPSRLYRLKCNKS